MARTTFWFSERIQFYQNDKLLLLNKPYYDKNAYIRIILLTIERYIYHICFKKIQFSKNIIQKSNILKLNKDIIIEIKKYLSIIDCFNLMLTCYQMWYTIGYSVTFIYPYPVCYFAMKRNTPEYKLSSKKYLNFYNSWYYGYEGIKYSSSPSFIKPDIILPFKQQNKLTCNFLLNIYYLLLKEISYWLDNQYINYRRYNVYPHGYNTTSRCVNIVDSTKIQEYFKIIGMLPIYNFILKIFNTKIKHIKRYEYRRNIESFNSEEVYNIFLCLKKLQPFWKPLDKHLDLDVILNFFKDCLNDNIEFIVKDFCINATFI